MARRVLFLRNFDMRVSTSRGLAIIAYRKGMEPLPSRSTCHGMRIEAPRLDTP